MGKDAKGNEMKLYVRHALKKAERQLEKTRDTIRYKASKKRCNLYVKNFPTTWTEEDLRNLFQQYGEIEKIRLEKGQTGNSYAFVCFKQPDAAATAKQALHNQTHDGKVLMINHYEIKEVRDQKIQEIKDKSISRSTRLNNLEDSNGTIFQATHTSLRSFNNFLDSSNKMRP